MVTIETQTARTAGITTVKATVTNTHSTAQTVRVASRLEGPVWPPRRESVTDPRWTDGIWEATLKPGRTHGVGFASPAPPVEPAMEIVSYERHEGDEADTSPAAVLATLDAWSPTRAVLERRL